MAYIGNSPQSQGFTPAIDYFSGNGVTVTFTLSRPLVSTAQVIAVIENVPQNPSTAFSVSGNSITFTSAPPSGSNNIWVEYTSLITQYNAISQDPSVIGDITATGGFLAVGDFGNTYTDGTIVDYVTGNARITTGPADGLTIYNGGTSARNALMAIDSSGNVGIGTSPSNKLSVASASASNGIVAQFTNSGSTGAGIDFLQSGVDNFSLTMPTGTGGLRFIASGSNERMRIDASGNLLVNTTSSTTINTGVLTVANPGEVIIGHPSGTVSTWGYVGFRYANATIGGITQNGTTAVAYNTTSDYRLKENITPMTGALAKVSQLKPVTYKWKSDGSDGQGFIAHELQEVVPDCVTGEKDAVDAEGKPVYQGIDTSFLVATLTAAIQELKAEIDLLKAGK